MITLFTIPKPFKGHIGIIQRNAIHSWALLHPECEVILFGDEEGTADVAKELNLHYVPEIARNEYGTPLVSDAFKKAQRLASNDLVCYINADIILLKDFILAVDRVSKKKRFLMVGQRWNLDLDRPLVFNENWENDIRNLIRLKGQLNPKLGIDYFIFPRGLLNDIPDFAVGRPYWDNWMIYNGRSSGFHVIDATEVVTAVHQNHDHSHIPQKVVGKVYEGPECGKNLSLAGKKHYNLEHANYFLKKRWLRPAFENPFLHAFNYSIWRLKILYRKLKGDMLQ